MKDYHQFTHSRLTIQVGSFREWLVLEAADALSKNTRSMRDELERIKAEFRKLSVRDEGSRKRLTMEAETVAHHAASPESAQRFSKELRAISFYPMAAWVGGPDHTPETWRDGIEESIGLIDGLIHNIELAERVNKPKPFKNAESAPGSRVFIVHGHDKLMLAAVEAYVRRLSLDVVVLGEEPNKGRTLIEKFEGHGDVSFAIVLLSPDDVGRSYSAPQQNERRRPRQNAVLELGYFVGRLGRSRVAAVFDASVENVDYPSDISGVGYVPYTPGHSEWKLLLVRELRGAEMPIDDDKV